MAIIQRFKSLDRYFASTDRKLLVNDLEIYEDIRNLVYTTYEKEVSMIPQCECGAIRATYLLGQTCDKCNTTVIKPFDRLDPILWVAKFKPDLPFINPKFVSNFNRMLGKKVDAFRWLTDKGYNPAKIPPVLLSIKAIIGGRGYRNFISSVEKILKFLLQNKQYSKGYRKVKFRILLHNFTRNKDTIFSSYLPFINKNLFIMEKTSKGNYASSVLSDIIDSVMLAISAANDEFITDDKLETVMSKLIVKTNDLFSKYVEELVSKKNGLIRKNIYATRAHFTFRTVITSLGTEYDYDTLHVPWEILSTDFRPHVYNKLLKRGYTPKTADELLLRSCKMYNEELDKIAQELIEESPYKGIPVLMNRNPSLKQGSIQLVYITKFKTSPEVHSTSVSIGIVKAPNGERLAA